MKKEEKIAENYLIQCGFINCIIHEPEGESKFPDFAINTSIAIEVRRLNQNYFNTSKVEGLEQKEISLFKKMSLLLKQFDHYLDELNYEQNYSVKYKFKRPFQFNEKIINAKIEQHAISQFIKKGNKIPDNYEINDIHENFLLRFIPRSNNKKKLFRCGSYVDYDSCGYISDSIRSLKHCIQDKTDKLLKNKCLYKKYDKWWLILIDEIFRDLDDNEVNYIRDIRNEMSIDYWSKIILLLDTGAVVIEF